MSQALSLSIAALLASAAALPAQSPATGSLDALVEAERSFARAARERGIRAGFLEWLADGSTVFAPHPTDARALYGARPESPALLAWRPEVAEIAAAGDLGWTSGPWSFHPEGPGSRAVAHGHFVSVWRRQAEGAWRVEVDGGVGHPPAPAADTLAVERIAPAGASARAPDSAAALRALAELDDALSAALVAGGAAGTAGAIVDDHVRVYREGSPPASGAAAWRAAARSAARPTAADRRGSGVSRLGDLGYTFGVLHDAAGGTSYYRIWRRGDAGWRVAVDVEIPPPPTAPPASSAGGGEGSDGPADSSRERSGPNASPDGSNGTGGGSAADGAS